MNSDPTINTGRVPMKINRTTKIENTENKTYDLKSKWLRH